MGLEAVATALERVKSVLARRPELGRRDNAAGTARWEGGLRFTVSDPHGLGVETDMPVEMGGTGDRVSPGWLFRAGLASCAATRIAMGAALEGIALTVLEVKACSRSDVRGLFAMTDASGEAVCASSTDIELHVRIGADGVAPERLRALIDESHRCSPISQAVQAAMPIDVRVEIA